MSAIINDSVLADELIRRRRESGADKYDEVWDGVYVMAPLANDEHQDLVDQFATILTVTVQWKGLGKVRPGVNVSDRRDDWRSNYRCPDVVVYLNNTAAENCGTHWRGGPDLAIEVTSPDDATLDKLPFYAQVGTRELLVVDRDPWRLTHYRLQDGELVESGRSTADNAVLLTSSVVPLQFSLAADDPPKFDVAHADRVQKWTIEPGQ
jgi:Uma2 family endonuclease